MDVMEKTASEKRLIDANLLVKDLEFLAKHEDSFRQSVILGVVQTVNTWPTVDAVEVVRCNNCLYSTERYGHIDCIHGVSYRNTWNKPDFYCAYGERKEG